MNLDTKKFRSLSIKDLLDAREHYHLHLMNKRNVIATAIGRFRFRHGEHIPGKKTKPVKGAKKEAKEFRNTETRPYSWPCVMVFVDDWIPEGAFVPDEDAGDDKTSLGDLVPRTLFLPDGREVPVCVMYAKKQGTRADPVDFRNLVFPEHIIGSGYPVISRVQNQEHIATIGGLVTDGHTTYALTNRHVGGEPGEKLCTYVKGKLVEIGTSAKKQLSRKKFSEVYPSWPGSDVFLNMDVGLIEMKNLDYWTAQVYGIGTPGRMVDLSDHNISLDLIGSRVCAFGCVSRQMKGEILALFYRYKALGGFEYVADFLIGKRKGRTSPPLITRHGDSASLWMLDTTRDVKKEPGAGRGTAGRTPAPEGKKPGPDDLYRPIAIQWGGQVFLDSTGKYESPFVLATCLSTVCAQLELDFVRDLNIGLDEYWGRRGHYTIATIACGLIRNEKLGELMNNNLNRISFEPGDMTDENLKELKAGTFVPLADVPDIPWQGRPPVRKDEAPNHFADMDQKDSNGETLLTLCEHHPENVNVDVWKAYYDDVGNEGRGVLPFRIWQIYDEMVDYVREGRVREFVCAAGILAHYVGDSTNSLHLSYLHHGDPDDQVEVKSEKPDAEKKYRNRADGIHAAYETDMLSRHKDDIFKGLDALAAKDEPLDLIRGGKEAAVTMVDVMIRTHTLMPPLDMIGVYNDRDDGRRLSAADRIWEKYEDQTIQVLFDACRYLALLWESAWVEGDGDSTIEKTEKIDREVLMDIYSKAAFLPSHPLDTIGQVLR